MPNTYFNSVVRVGNWYEDRRLSEEKSRAFKFYRDNGFLLSTKFDQLFANFNREIILVPAQKVVNFGAIVQLMPYRMNICNVDTITTKMALSVILTEQVVGHSQHISSECELTIAPSDKPVVRSSFRIVSADETDRTNEALKYGQHFRLECVDDTESILVFSAQKMPNLGSVIQTRYGSLRHGEVNLPLGLVWRKHCGPDKSISLAYCNWFCKHSNPKHRLRSEGLPVPSNVPIIITHLATNRNLAAENTVIQTLFGAEFLVSVQTYKDIHGREMWHNLWMICDGHQYD